MIGHLDGIRDHEYICGWCAGNNQYDDKIVWLRCNNFKPIALKCNIERDDIHHNFIKDNSGFRISFNDLPYEWNNKNIC